MLNRLMHPRNKYKTPPDFRSLAIKYPEFRKYAKQDLSGKVKLDFKDIQAMRALTTTLLKEDFGLEVEIPLSRLIPTLPLRLNYLLWMEDILIHNNMISPEKIIKGIDIGCGASCIYPFLAAKQFNWNMLATEVDKDSIEIAISNVKRNNLQDKITVLPVEEGIVLKGAIQSGNEYDFSMCNPPFFSSEDELLPQNVARTPSRAEPRNAHSGIASELVFPGGEIAFVRKIIQDSLKLQKSIRVYSVMVGHKSSLAPLQRELKEAGVKQIGIGQFCQGRTTRWGLAWTLDPAVSFPPSKDRPTSQKQMAPFSTDIDMNVSATVAKLHQLMNELKIKYSTLKNKEELNAMEISAVENTWSNSRKKRRQEKLKSKSCESDQNQAKNLDHEGVKTSSETSCEDGARKNEVLCVNQDAQSNSAVVETVNHLHDVEKRTSPNNVRSKRERSDSESVEVTDSKRLKTDSSASEPLLCGSLVVRRRDTGSVVELSWHRGRGGRDVAHQVLQHFKNNLKNS